MTFWADRLDATIAGNEGDAPFLKSLIMPKLVRWETGRTWFEWEIDPRTVNFVGVVFGGQLALMADRVFALTAISVLEAHEHFTTSDLRISFFRPAIKGTLHIEGSVVHRGRRLVQVEAVFSNDDGKLIAKAVGTQYIIERVAGVTDGNVEE